MVVLVVPRNMIDVAFCILRAAQVAHYKLSWTRGRLQCTFFEIRSARIRRRGEFSGFVEVL